jgi:hypothetical protein
MHHQVMQCTQLTGAPRRYNLGDVAAWLLSHGADRGAVDADGDAPADVAEFHGHT